MLLNRQYLLLGLNVCLPNLPLVVVHRRPLSGLTVVLTFVTTLLMRRCTLGRSAPYYVRKLVSMLVVPLCLYMLSRLLLQPLIA